MKRAKHSARAAPVEPIDWSGAPAWLVEAIQRVDKLNLEDFNKLTVPQLDNAYGVIEAVLNQVHNAMLTRLLQKSHPPRSANRGKRDG